MEGRPGLASSPAVQQAEDPVTEDYSSVAVALQLCQHNSMAQTQPTGMKGVFPSP